MTCPYCGAAAKPNTSYCTTCGQLLAAAVPPSPPPSAALPPPTGGSPAGAPERGAIPALPPLPPLGPRPPVPLPAPLGADPVLAPAPAPASPAPPPPAAARPAVLRLPDGAEAPLEGQLVLGRNPSSAELEGHRMLALEDPRKMLSRSHLAIDARGARVTAMDLGSANGTTLVRGGAATPLGARLPVILEPGDTLVIGSLQLVVG